MFEKNMRIAYLLDLYGDVLDDHSRAIMLAYYEDDLSLAEIAEGENISRQGVRHIIKKSEEQLDFLESKLALANLFSNIDSVSSELGEIANSLLRDSKYSEYAQRLRNLSEKLQNKNN